MPFQGNPNAGQADPALLNMLFQQKQRRDEIEWEKQKFAIQAERQAKLDAAEDNRKAQLHRIKLATGIADLKAKVDTQTTDLGESEAAANQQMGQVAEQAPVSPYAQQAFQPVEQRPAGLFPLEAPDQANLGVQRQAAEDIYAPVMAKRAALATTLSQVPELAPIMDTLPQQGRNAVARQARTAGIELDKTTAAEGRANTEADRRTLIDERIAQKAATLAYQRDVGSLSAELDSVQSTIEKQAQIMATAPIGSSEYARAKARHDNAKSALSKKLLSGVDPAHFTNLQQWEDNNVSFAQEAETVIADGRKFLELADKNKNFLGTTRGGLTQYISNAYEGIADVGAVSNQPLLQMSANVTRYVVDSFMNDPSLTPAQRDTLGREMGFNAEGTLQARSDAKALSSQMAYMLTRGQNPGRFSDGQYKKNLDLVRIDQGTAAQALRNLRTGIAALEGMATRTKQRISVYEQLSPGATGGFEDQSGNVVLPPSQGTNYESLKPEGESSLSQEPAPVIGKSGLPLLQPKAPAAVGASGLSADRYMELSPEEKAAFLEQQLMKAN
jgi:hypothetical protein